MRQVLLECLVLGLAVWLASVVVLHRNLWQMHGSYSDGQDNPMLCLCHSSQLLHNYSSVSPFPMGISYILQSVPRHCHSKSILHLSLLPRVVI